MQQGIRATRNDRSFPPIFGTTLHYSISKGCLKISLNRKAYYFQVSSPISISLLESLKEVYSRFLQCTTVLDKKDIINV